MSGLFTVLIAEKEHIDAIRKENKLFFEPFLNSKDLAFCCWNPLGRTINEAVPELLDTVGREKQWRAVIINNCSEETVKTRNPFDSADDSVIKSITTPSQQPNDGETSDEWISKWEIYFEALTKAKNEMYRNTLELPLQKLATWLCFRPEDYILNDVKDKQSIHEWALECLEGDEIKPSTRLEILERNQYKCELRLKESLRREFMDDKYLNIAYPSEVHCISTRTTENTFFDPDVYWNIPSDNDYSAFADRNMYFDKMRFMVFDLLPETHRNFRTDYIRFLASVLIFVSNPTPISAMQARRLYLLEAETDETPLRILVNSYNKKLESTAEVIENEMERIRNEIPSELTDKVAESLFCTPKDVAVLLDESCDTEKVFAKNNYGLSYDCPENEHHKWNREYDSSQKELAYIIKQQSRAVKKSVNQAHYASEVIDVNINRLTPLQIDDVKDYTNNSENEMVASIPPDFSDISKYTDRMAEQSENVKKVLSRRMSRKVTIVLSAVCLVLYLICYLPFFFTNNSTPVTVSTAILFTAAMLGLLASIMFITLFFLRSSVKKAVKAFNDTARGVINDIETYLKKVSKYLSAMCSVRRGFSVQNHANKNVDEFTKSLRIRRKHLEDIRKKRAQLLEDYEEYFDDKKYCDEVMSRPYDYNFDLQMEYDYAAPFLAGDVRQIEFMNSGNYVTVPSSYVTKISVRMEGIYDK